MLSDHGGELESVQLGHADVDQNDGNFILEQEFERFAPGSRSDKIFPKLL